MKISIALCTFNGAEFIGQQIDSIINQSVVPSELIICDDGSSDNTVDIIEEISKSCPFAIKIVKNNIRLGFVKNFEQAILLCSGDIIFLCDQDDVWHEEKIEMTIAEFEHDDDVMAVFTNADVVSDRLVSLGHTMFDHVGFGEQEKNSVLNGGDFELALSMFFVTGMTLAFKTELTPAIVPIPTHNPSIIHDRWIALIASAVGKLAFVDVPLVRYRQHGNQQIGASKVVRGQWTLAGPNGERGFAHHAANAESFRLIEKRTSAMRRGEKQALIPKLLQPRIVHLQARAKMDRSRLGRTPLILRELFTLRYFRYSTGFFSAVKDFLT